MEERIAKNEHDRYRKYIFSKRRSQRKHYWSSDYYSEGGRSLEGNITVTKKSFWRKKEPIGAFLEENRIVKQIGATGIITKTMIIFLEEKEAKKGKYG